MQRAMTSLFLGGLAASSWAQSRGEWVISNGFGASSTARSAIRVDQNASQTHLTYRGVKWSDEANEWPPIYNFRAVYWKSPEAAIGYGFEFLHFKYIADPEQTVRVGGTLNGGAYTHTEPLGNTLQRWTITNGLNVLNGVVVARKRYAVSEGYASGRSSIYAGGGAGIAIPHPVTRFLNGPSSGGYHYGGFSWHLLAGAEWRITPKLGLFAEVKYTQYNANVEMTQGARGSAKLKTSAIFLGTNLRF